MHNRMKPVWASVIGVVLILSPGAGRLSTPTANAVTGAPAAGHAPASGAGTLTCDPNDLPGASEGPDDDGDECAFTIDGKIPVPTPSSGLGEFAEGSPALARTCAVFNFGAARGIADLAATYISRQGAPYALSWINHFLNGTGTPVEADPGTSPLRGGQE